MFFNFIFIGHKLLDFSLDLSVSFVSWPHGFYQGVLVFCISWFLISSMAALAPLPVWVVCCALPGPGYWDFLLGVSLELESSVSTHRPDARALLGPWSGTGWFFVCLFFSFVCLFSAFSSIYYRRIH